MLEGKILGIPNVLLFVIITTSLLVIVPMVVLNVATHEKLDTIKNENQNVKTLLQQVKRDRVTPTVTVGAPTPTEEPTPTVRPRTRTSTSSGTLR